MSDIVNMTEELKKIFNMHPLNGLTIDQKDTIEGQIIEQILVNKHNNHTNNHEEL